MRYPCFDLLNILLVTHESHTRIGLAIIVASSTLKVTWDTVILLHNCGILIYTIIVSCWQVIYEAAQKPKLCTASPTPCGTSKLYCDSYVPLKLVHLVYHTDYMGGGNAKLNTVNNVQNKTINWEMKVKTLK